jgi:inorganic pyrophosphatase
MLYGFVPRTHCGPRVAALCPDAPRADDDPLDICVLSERPINRSEILLEATVVGGLQMIDGDEADDKLVAVLATDPVWAGCTDIAELPRTLVDRLAHYFTTYKLEPGQPPRSVIRSIYGHEHAFEVVTAAAADYLQAFGTPAPSPPPAW